MRLQAGERRLCWGQDELPGLRSENLDKDGTVLCVEHLNVDAVGTSNHLQRVRYLTEASKEWAWNMPDWAEEAVEYRMK